VTDWYMASRRLYLCTPDRHDLTTFVAECIGGGVDVVQLREKDADDERILERSKLLVQVCNDLGVPFILNDRPDLALECGADGVHVGQEDAAPELARRILGDEAIVGLSTHAPDQLRSSWSEPVDYISAGPVTETPTKPGRPGTGIGYIATAVSESSRPVFVTGGVTPETVPGLAAAGATHFVVVRYLTGSADPRRAASLLRDSIDRSVYDAGG
jgi:thiamine-phosphate pyrophosphorylase